MVPTTQRTYGSTGTHWEEDKHTGALDETVELISRKALTRYLGVAVIFIVPALCAAAGKQLSSSQHLPLQVNSCHWLANS